MGTIRIDKKTLEDLEFPTVLKQISEYCVTEPGRNKVISITPFTSSEEITPELLRLKEFRDSLGGDNQIPNHGFEPIFRELQLLEIENSSLDSSGFRKILSVSETTGILLKFFKKYEEFYINLNEFSEDVNYTSVISEAIQKIFDKYGVVKNEASNELATIRRRLGVVKSQINTSFAKSLSRYSQAEYLDEIRETIVDNRRVLAVKAMYRKKINGAVLGNSKTGSIVYIEPQETLEFTNELSNLLYEEQEEIKRILKALTAYIRPYESYIESYQSYLIAIDTLFAKAKYSVKISGVMPLLTAEKRLFLKDAYHPLLLVSNKKRKEKPFRKVLY